MYHNHIIFKYWIIFINLSIDDNIPPKYSVEPCLLYENYSEMYTGWVFGDTQWLYNVQLYIVQLKLKLLSSKSYNWCIYIYFLCPLVQAVNKIGPSMGYRGQDRVF